MVVTEPSLLLLIPAYNEERRIEPVLRDFGRYCSENYSGKFQLVVVLNGCRDNTLGVVKRVAAEFPFISALDFPDPIGKGGALIEGLKLAPAADLIDRKSTRLNSSHGYISYAVFCLKKKKNTRLSSDRAERDSA